VSPSRGIREFELREYSEWSPLVDPSEKPVRLTRTENGLYPDFYLVLSPFQIIFFRKDGKSFAVDFIRR